MKRSLEGVPGTQWMRDAKLNKHLGMIMFPVLAIMTVARIAHYLSS